MDTKVRFYEISISASFVVENSLILLRIMKRQCLAGRPRRVKISTTFNKCGNVDAIIHLSDNSLAALRCEAKMSGQESE